MLTRTSKHFAMHALCKTAVLDAFAFVSPAQALQWNIVSGTATDNGLAVSGNFSFDDELLANPVMLASNVTVDGLVFGAADLLQVTSTPGVGITAIDWLDTGNNLLALAFDMPLTPQGGTVSLDNTVSTYTAFSTSTPSFITGSISGPPSAVPGPMPALGAGAALAWTRKIKRKISMANPNQVFKL